MKWFLVGWVCLGFGVDQECVRMGSEVIHETYQSCNEYYQAVTQKVRDLESVTLKFTCVQAGQIEDLL
jgi:hypothetical protein